MANKEYILQRICVYAGKDIDPTSDEQVGEILRNKFNIILPQRRSLDESLSSTSNDHEIIDLIIKYRNMCSESVNAKKPTMTRRMSDSL